MDARRVGQTARERTRDLSRPGRIMPRRSRSRTAELTPQGGRVQREPLLPICEPGLAAKCLRQADGPPPRERGVPRLKLAPFGTSGRLPRKHVRLLVRLLRSREKLEPSSIPLPGPCLTRLRRPLAARGRGSGGRSCESVDPSLRFTGRCLILRLAWGWPRGYDDD